MKRLLTLTIAMLALIALVVAPATSFAGNYGAGHKTTDAKQASAHCSEKDVAACAAKLGLSPEECKELCAVESHSFVCLSIEGMTCEACEKSITACLEEIPGVMKVGLVSHKDGTAFAVIDTKQVKEAMLAKAVTNKGYKAEVIPAVALMVPDSEIKPASSAKGCGMVSKKVCSPTCAVTCGAKGVKKTRKTEEAGDPTGTK